MSKAEEPAQEISAVNPRLPIVAAGTGKTIENEGATQKEVYNVRRNHGPRDI
jgi:hypothetical protein